MIFNTGSLPVGGIPPVTNSLFSRLQPAFIFPKLCTVIEFLAAIKKVPSVFLIQRIVFFYMVHGRHSGLGIHKPQVRFFCPAGATRSTDSRQTWQGRRAHGSVWLCKISPSSPQECGNGIGVPKISKISTFWENSHPCRLS